MTSNEEQIRAIVARQAADWFIANQDATPSQSERTAFVAWLKASPIHIEEYLGVALIARDLPAVADDPELSLESLVALARADVADSVVPVPTLLRSKPVTRRVLMPRQWSMAGAAALVALAAVVFWWTNADQPGNLAQTYRTERGDLALENLPDGSSLHLNTETVANVKYGHRDRLVQIVSGQALFDVMHGDPRAFRVVAGDVEVVAVGTRFDVRLKGQSTVVTVVDGQVNVRTETRAGAPPARAMRVSTGYQLRIDGGVMPAHSERVDTRAAVAWLQRKIAFERQPLGEVVDEFNRYGIVQITIDDAALRTLPVSGVFAADDTNSFAAFLETLDGVRVERTPTMIRVVRSKPAIPGKGPAVN